MKKTVSTLLAAAVLFFAAAAGAGGGRDDFVRGVWVCSVSNLNYPSERGLSDEALRNEADKIIENCAALGMNTIFFQVRPCADALYNSALFPKSVYLTGKSTYEPLSFDPLAYMTEQAHLHGMELHAWINPYRVTGRTSPELEDFSPDSPQRLHPEHLLFPGDGSCWFNPALQEVRDLVTAGVVEILENYDVDGIHFDDYFYPEGDVDDSALFEASGYSDVGDWRRDNVNALVRQVSEAVRSRGLVFGISPRGIWANAEEMPGGSATSGGGSYSTIYCDTLRFIDEGLVDYICPQIYWNIGYSQADYSVLVPWWAEAVSGTDVRLYIGMADYRAADPDESLVWHGSDQFARQLDLNEQSPAVSGEVHFNYGSIVNSPTLTQLYRSRYHKPESKSGSELLADKLRRMVIIVIKKLLCG